MSTGKIKASIGPRRQTAKPQGLADGSELRVSLDAMVLGQPIHTEQGRSGGQMHGLAAVEKDMAGRLLCENHWQLNSLH